MFEHFKARQGQHYVLCLDGGAELQTLLLEVCALKKPALDERTPFSLLFKGPAAPLLPQRTYRLRQVADNESLDMFMVPVSADATGVHYEAVFS